ncbi:MAG: hypothetical protein HFH82_09290 [Lachnospiraceae bacterium]|nr:hypothetical protein [Lachnospiraceae bacterium]
MKIATILFTYKRSYHTKQVIEALRQNTVLPAKLFVFQDGLGSEEDAYEWNKVNELIQGIDWCDKEVMVSESNRGLASSIVTGINYVFKEYDAIIVLEDDCVPAASFISFMCQCFEKYQNHKNIYSISGYSYPVSLEKRDADVYGCGRISSWGWGTWKDRWDIYKKDYELTRQLKREKISSENLALWGQDLEEMLVGNIRGNCNSWAVFWALNVISKGGICINPYKSLIQNIGTDGTGTNCGVTDFYKVKMYDEVDKEFHLPDEIVFLNDTIEAFVPLFGSYTAVNQRADFKKNILVYGVGTFYMEYEKEINKEYFIEAFVDQRKKGWFAGKEIIRINEIVKYTFDKILIMVKNIQQCINIVKELTSGGIDGACLLIGHNFYGEYSKCIDRISVLSGGKLSVKYKGKEKQVQSKEEFEEICREV